MPVITRSQSRRPLTEEEISIECKNMKQLLDRINGVSCKNKRTEIIIDVYVHLNNEFLQKVIIPRPDYPSSQKFIQVLKIKRKDLVEDMEVSKEMIQPKLNKILRNLLKQTTEIIDSIAV